MKVLLINGSPNADGCTYRALSEVAAELERNGVDTEIAQIGKRAVSGCTDCGACRGKSRCIIEDAVNVMLDKLDSSDGLIVGSPVYFASPNGSLTALLDRMFRNAASAQHKPAAAVVSARRAGTTASLDVIYKYFLINNMPVVPSSYWAMVHGNTPGEVERDEEGLEIMRNLGKNMAWLLGCIQMGRKSGIESPALDSGKRTNFIR